jgi:hypothetical protein
MGGPCIRSVRNQIVLDIPEAFPYRQPMTNHVPVNINDINKLSSTPAPFGNDPGKIARYQAFWSRADVKRPLVGFTTRGWFPLDEYAATRAWPVNTELTPEMVVPEAFLEDEERLLSEGELLDDDIIRGDMPAAAVIPWLSGIMGSRLRILPGNVLGADREATWDEFDRLRLAPENPWLRKYVEFARALVRHAAGRYPVSHGALVGPCDILGELRGHTQSILDMMEEPEQAMQALWRATHLCDEINQEIWSHLPLWHGGYYDGMYQLWAPGPIIRMQEDASALYSPTLYRKFLQPLDRYLAGRYANAFIHLHSTSMFILDAFLEIEELSCLEINNDATGPPLAEMVPYFRMVQRAKRSLVIRGSLPPDDARLLMDALEPRGLYLLVVVKDHREADALRPILGM